MAEKSKKQTTLSFFVKPKEDNELSRKRKDSKDEWEKSKKITSAFLTHWLEVIPAGLNTIPLGIRGAMAHQSSWCKSC